MSPYPPTRRPVRVRRAALSTATTAAPMTGRCNTVLPSGRACRLPAGARTDHVGTGPCWQHDTAPDTIQRYRGLRSESVAARLRTLHRAERDVMDLIPELQLARSLLMDMVERHEELVEAIIEWYRSNRQKPSNVPDISQVLAGIETVSRVVERIHKMQSTGAMSLDTFRRIVEQMGVAVARHVTNGAALEAIEAEWAAVVVQTRAGASAQKALPSAHTEAVAVPPGRHVAVVDAAAPPDGAPSLSVSTRGRRRRKPGE